MVQNVFQVTDFPVFLIKSVVFLSNLFKFNFLKRKCINVFALVSAGIRKRVSIHFNNSIRPSEDLRQGKNSFHTL